MWELDQALKDLELDAEALRESITSLNSLDICAGMITPGTSPASSVQPSSPKQNQGRRPSLAAINTRRPPSAIGSNSSSSARRRQQSASTTPPLSPWGSTTPTSSAMQRAYSTPSANGSYSSSSSSRTAETKKPRWNSGAKVDDTQIGHNFKPLNLTMPSPYRKTTPQSTSGSRRDSSSRTSSAMGTRLPLPSPLRSATTPTPQTPGYLRAGSSAAMRRPYLTSPCPASSKPSLRRQSSNTQLNSGGDSSTSMSYSDFMKTSNSSDYGSSGGSTNGSGSGPRINVRPATSMAGRRSSMMTGRQTPAGTRSGAATPNGTGKRCSMPYGSTSGLAWSKEMGAGGKPRWRY